MPRLCIRSLSNLASTLTFFEIGTTPRLDYVEEVEKQLRYLRVNRHYEEMMDLVKTEEKNPLFYRDNENLQLLYWHKGIYQYEVEKDPETSFELLDHAFQMSANGKKAMSEREMQILSSVGTIHFSLCLYEEALYYFKQVETCIQTTDLLQDKSIKSRIFYNMARVLTGIGQLEDSTAYCLDAIKWCFEEELLWGLDQLHYQVGYNYELLGDYEKALP
ncbi:hypothetical protein [Rossellomorea sp. y25]|uniref:hypothetical protein n=1 Tax=Rossellomorea sp. y25 TaxID=3118174 RepID=UPI0030E07A23